VSADYTTRYDKPEFGGVTYDEALDRDRLRKQLHRVYEALSDGQWHTDAELARIAGCTEGSAGARRRDLRKSAFGGHTIEAKRIMRGLWAYRMVAETNEEVMPQTQAS
jgi:hypothetical protein